MRYRSLALAAFAASSVLSSAHAAAGELLYALENSTLLSSTDTGWDYIKMEPGGSRLFMARASDGLTVFDVDRSKTVATVENSAGANGPLLLPEYNRGYVAMTDGSLLSFNLKTLQLIERLSLASDGGLNSAVHDPVTKQIHAIVGGRPSESTWFTLDAATGKLIKKTTFPFKKMDDPAVDGKGHLFAPARRDNLILKLDSKTLAEQARWPVECNVAKVRYQAATNRILAACSGEQPLFFALDASTGRTVAKIPIGKGMDALVIDEQRHRIVTAHGTDSSLFVIQQSGPDAYELLGTVSTRVGARMMHIDERSGRLFVVAADYTTGKPDASGVSTRTYHPNSFAVLTYKPQ
ncbi:hypothetical protein [Steroidobacter sp.]|uniref:hypothetical protein n=1 Tax=Steroidobacter sp. TaxID=1978227 RepID=UPI001A3D4694|nr:hypothetical protein [Steroidobacter sp.]MBL8266505.1 hypothetical protein [Steroidobacter sp.]